MTKTHIRRLEKLATHLEKGKLEHKKFNFAVINADRRGRELEVNGCGYAGCALGEMPAAFPSAFQWHYGFPKSRQRNGKGVGAFDDVMEFFGIIYEEAEHLFQPSYSDSWTYQKPKLYGGKILGSKATREQVAANIRAFIAIKKKEVV
jgi:hypothetical protein